MKKEVEKKVIKGRRAWRNGSKKDGDGGTGETEERRWLNQLSFFH